jgi:hypothetical protein
MLIVLSAAEIVDILDGTHSLSMLSETRRDSSQFCIFRSVTGVVGIHLLTTWPKAEVPGPGARDDISSLCYWIIISAVFMG